ncbi:hypothetical protein AB834_06425 [PVC group bacterium (ex Bugula neritina AB1)]|nr:hypothetical protein AB834_06425 [PVC group bacterium (ex Bugula neritina AB1)]
MVKKSNPKGFILIYTLWIINILTVLTACLSFLFESNKSLVQKHQQSLIHKQYLKNGLQIAISKIKAQKSHAKSSLIDLTETILYEKTNIVNTITVRDIGSRLNVNFHPLELLQQVPGIDSHVLGKIRKTHRQGQLITHLSDIDPYYKNKKWSQFLTTHGNPSLNFSTIPQILLFFKNQKVSPKDLLLIENYLSDLFNDQRDHDKKKEDTDFTSSWDFDNDLKDETLEDKHVKTLLTKHINQKSSINVNEAPDEVRDIILKHIGLSLEKRSFLKDFLKQKHLFSKIIENSQDSEQQLTLDEEVLQTIEKHLSFETSFYKIILTLTEENSKEIFFKAEAVLERVFTLDKNNHIKIISWVMINHD